MWANDQNETFSHLTPSVAVSYCKRVFNKVKNLSPDEPIEAHIPPYFTPKERAAGLLEERHHESLTQVALEYFEMLKEVEKAAQDFLNKENLVL